MSIERDYTPEPWSAVRDSDDAPDMGFDGNYQRARTCVNACAGMVNPEMEIAQLKADIHIARSIIARHPV